MKIIIIDTNDLYLWLENRLLKYDKLKLIERTVNMQLTFSIKCISIV